MDATFLTDGGQTDQAIASLLAGFLGEAERSLEIAIYDLRLAGTAADTLKAAVEAAKARGVAVRIAFNVEHPRRIPVPPPPNVDWDLVRGLAVPIQPISGVPDLMHHKYVVRDAGSPGAAVWTGSTNWTTDSWTREENVIVRVHLPQVAEQYRANFEELWTGKQVARSGHTDPPWTEVQIGGVSARLRPLFSPGHARKLVHEIAQRMGAASRRIRICSPVITSGPILGTLAESVNESGLDVAGVFDRTQMDEVERQWGQEERSAWKIEAFKSVVARASFGAKRSTPYSSGSVHDFMHAKLVVADDYVFTGSFNLSHSGEMNAENVVEIEDAGTAEIFAGFIDRLRARYKVAS